MKCDENATSAIYVPISEKRNKFVSQINRFKQTFLTLIHLRFLSTAGLI